MADACWFKRVPTPEGTPEKPEDWEGGTLYQFDQHGTHGYAAIVSAANDGKILLIPFKDVSMIDPATPPVREGGTRHEAIEHPKTVHKSPDTHRGH